MTWVFTAASANINPFFWATGSVSCVDGVKKIRPGCICTAKRNEILGVYYLTFMYKVIEIIWF